MVFAQTLFLEQVSNNFLDIGVAFVVAEFAVNPLDHLLVSLLFPDAVAAHNYEVSFRI